MSPIATGAEPRRLVLVGLPRSGKSSFLAALRHLLISAEVPTSLTLERSLGDMTHINKLARDWQHLTPFERTMPADEAWLPWMLRDRGTNTVSELRLPDLSGERFAQMAGLRLCPPNLFDAMLKADGLLLFVNAERTQEDLTIADLSQYPPAAEVQAEVAADIGEKSATEAQLKAADMHDGKPPATQSLSPVPWDPMSMPEQAQLVEVLGVLNRHPQRPRHRRVAIIISAWDLVGGNGVTPEAWLEEHRFMLLRYLKNNPELFQCRFYGVSAWGGRPKEDAEKLRRFVEASKRIGVVGPDAAEHDLTAPLRWLMSQDS